MLKLLILTAHKDTLSWQSLPNKLAYLKSIIQTGKNADFSIDIVYTPAFPKVDLDDEKINHAWLNNLFQTYYKKGYDIVAFHFSEHQKNAWGIRPTLRGSNPNTDDEFGDFWFSADEHTERVDYNRFEQVFLHELSHEYFSDVKETDVTHEYHDKHKNIAGLYTALDWSKFQKRRQGQKKQLSLLQSIVAALTARLAVKKVTPDYNRKPTDLLPLVKRQADKFVQEMEMLGLPIRITEGYRSPERQNELYAQGRTTKGPVVTNAKAGESQHQYGNAIDIVFRKLGYDATNDQWLAAASVAERLGFDWGGDWENIGFVDKPHFELMKGYKLSDFQKKLVDYNKFK